MPFWLDYEGVGYSGVGMNYLNVVGRACREIDKALGSIKNQDTKLKAYEIVRGFAWSSDAYGLWKADKPVSEPVVGGVGAGVALEGEKPVEAKETAPVGESGFPVVATVSDGTTTTVFPADYVPEVEGDVGSTGTFYPETFTAGNVGGWPQEAEIQITGLTANRRMFLGRLPDGRTVNVERKLGLKGTVRGHIIQAGYRALYRAA